MRKTFKNLAAANDEIRRLLRENCSRVYHDVIDMRNNPGWIRLLINDKVFDVYYKTTKAERVSYAKTTT